MNRHFCPLRDIPLGVALFMATIALTAILAAWGSTPQ